MIVMTDPRRTIPAEPDAERHEDWADELLTGEAVALDLRPAPFALRAAGAAIDFVAYFGLYVGIILVAFMSVGAGAFDPAIGGILGIAGLVISLIVIPTAVETATRGKSLGKLAVGARIVREDGGSIGFRHALIRSLVGLLEVYMTIGGLAAIVGLLGRRSKRLGDLIAGTYSQYERVSKRVEPVFGIPNELVGWAQNADVARLPIQLNRRIAQFLGQASRLTPASRAKLAQGLANETAVFVSPVPDVDPELFLAGVTVLRRERETSALELERAGLERLGPALTGLPHGFPERG